MANPEHLEILKQGVEAWNRWRKENDDVKPDLRKAFFIDTNLRGVNLSGAYLDGVHLSGASLYGVDLGGASLTGADFSGASFLNVNFTNASLGGADFTKAELGGGSFGNNDLSQAKGLETVKHLYLSTIGIDTIYKSHGNIPEIFLRGCGVPEDFITYMRSLTRQAFEFYSCFISYSSKDDEFAKRLYADLQNEGVRCWFAPEDLKIGEKFRVRIDESIRLYDKLLLVLSKNSVSSQWVEKEVETAFEKEEEQKKTVLFPVRLDDAVLETKTGWAADVRRSRHIGDFREWKNHDSYRKAFERLMRDLKAEAQR